MYIHFGIYHVSWADVWESDYCNVNTECVNDGHQFLGLRSIDKEDLVVPEIPAIDRPNTPPIPVTPAKQQQGEASTPNAPRKKERTKDFSAFLKGVVKKLGRATTSKDPNSKDNTEDESEEYPLPDGITEASLGASLKIDRWEYFPFSADEDKKGIVDPKPEQGKVKLDKFLAPPSPAMTHAPLVLLDKTPSKPPTSRKSRPSKV